MSFRAIDLTGFSPAQIKDQPQPTMLWVNLDDVVIDTRYQRIVTVAGRRAIQRIADSFDWRKYQPIIVSPTESGKFAVVDGQHRAHAAAVCGIASLPAMLVPMTLAEQAMGFAAINRDRIAIDKPAIYRAELAAGVQWALDARAAVESAGCILATANASSKAKRPGTVYAVSLIRRMIEAGEGDAVTAGLAAIRSSIQGADSYVYSGHVLTVWLAAIAGNQRFLRIDLRKVFDSIDFDALFDDARRRARESGLAARDYVKAAVCAALRDELQGAAA